MLKACFKLVDGKLQECDRDAAQVFIYVAPDEAERRQLVDGLRIDEHTLNSSLDPDELARIEFEPDHVAAIFKRPRHYTACDQFLFKVASAGAFLFKDRLIVTMAEDAQLFDGGKLYMRMSSPMDVFLRILFRSVFHFLEHLRIINMISEQVEEKLIGAMENENLLHLFTLEKSLVYYLNAIHSNGALVERLKAFGAKMSLTTDQAEFLDDLQVENNQCLKQAEIYSNILSGMMDARASVVNNNLNVLMKRLTIITVVVAPLNIIAGIGGMSEYSRLAEALPGHPTIWYLVFCAGMLAFAWLTYRLLLLFAIDRNGGGGRRSKK